MNLIGLWGYPDILLVRADMLSSYLFEGEKGHGFTRLIQI